eukprot:scaffold15602_cov21-Tisochrysis_lutea.AAC.1
MIACLGNQPERAEDAGADKAHVKGGRQPGSCLEGCAAGHPGGPAAACARVHHAADGGQDAGSHGTAAGLQAQ